MSLRRTILTSIFAGAVLGFNVTAFMPDFSPQTDSSQWAYFNASHIALVLDGIPIHEDELPVEVRSSIYDADTSQHEKLKLILAQYALARVVATEKRLDLAQPLPSIDELVEIKELPEEELRHYFDANKDKFSPGADFAAVKFAIADHLRKQKLGEFLRAKNEELVALGRLKIVAPTPTPPRINMALDRYPAIGPANVPTLVTVFDYVSSLCQQQFSDVESLVRERGEAIRVVFVPYSARPEKLSGTLARGAYCAHTLNKEKFISYHRSAFNLSLQKTWTPESPAADGIATDIAIQAGYDQIAFSKCLLGNNATQFVAQTVASFNALGVHSAPFVFFSGRKLRMQTSLRDAVVAQLPQVATADKK